MAVYSERFELRTKGEVQAVDITERVESAVRKSRLQAGIGLVFSPSSTSAIVANESDAGVDVDLASLLDRMAHPRAGYAHEEKWHDGNGHSHVRASLLGAHFAFPIEGGRAALGTWQQVWFLELDNKPRTREVVVTIVGE